MKASHEERWVTVTTGRGQTEVKLQPGQFIFGRNQAAAELGDKPTSTYKRMLKLKKLENLNIQSNTHYSVVTICNWDKYQSELTKEEQPKEQPSDNQVTTKCQPSDTNKNVKNVKKEETVPRYLINNTHRDSLKFARRDKDRAAPPSPPVKPVITIPLIHRNGDGKPQEYPVTQQMIDEWVDLYPAVDILGELKKLKGWNLANPKNRKTSRGILRHINSWLSRAQDKARASPQQEKPKTRGELWNV